uniref:Uncharacterized protein n=1 Tax=Glossina brevipalpis TaxID=37001 RepID=A0A1A9W727_9MUSC
MVSFKVLKPRKLFYVTFILVFTQLWVNVLCGEKLVMSRTDIISIITKPFFRAIAPWVEHTTVILYVQAFMVHTSKPKSIRICEGASHE